MSGAALPYYKRFPRDFVEGTIGMKLEIKGAYSIILDLIYMRNGQLPDDPQYIAGVLGCSVRKWNSIRETLVEMGKIKAENDIISNLRADYLLEETRKYRDKNAENARGSNKNKGVEKRTPTKRARQPEPEPNSITDVIEIGSHVQAAYQMFVSAANRQPAWSIPKTLTKSRKASLTARLKELGGLRGWEALIERAEQSPFLTGQTHNQFNLAFDWLLKPANTLKVSEGNYDGKTHTGNTQTSASKTQRFAGGHSAHAGQRPNDTDRFIEALHEAADQHRDREARGRAWGDVDAPNVGVECSGGGSPQEPYTLEGIAYTSEQRAGGADAKSVSRDVSGDQAQQGSDSSGSLLDIDLHETTNRGRAVGF